LEPLAKLKSKLCAKKLNFKKYFNILKYIAFLFLMSQKKSRQAESTRFLQGFSQKTVTF